MRLGRWRTCRRSKREAKSWMRGRTCFRLERCCTRWRREQGAFRGNTAALIHDAILNREPSGLTETKKQRQDYGENADRRVGVPGGRAETHSAEGAGERPKIAVSERGGDANGFGAVEAGYGKRVGDEGEWSWRSGRRAAARNGLDRSGSGGVGADWEWWERWCIRDGMRRPAAKKWKRGSGNS